MTHQAKRETPDGIILENAKLKAVFSKENGALLHLASKATGWQIQNRPELGLSFNLMAPTPAKRTNYVRGKDQALKSYQMSDDGKSLEFQWENLNSEFAGRLDIKLRGIVKATDQGLLFTMEVVNQSQYVVECLSYPAIGDLAQPSAGEKMENYLLAYAGIAKINLLPSFSNQKGYWGVESPMQAHTTPDTPFVLSASATQGLYVGCHDSTNKEMTGFTYELKPGYDSEWHESIVTNAKASTEPARVEMNAWHFTFVNPSENHTTSDVLVSCFVGGWQHGVDVYKEWRKIWYRPPNHAKWLDEVHSWQQIQINSSEDNLLFKYKDLVSYARECARHGVKVIQLTGWNDGGQDRNNPSHDTDPRLGTWQELKDAIAECEKLGVHIILFTKFTWADRSTEWFRKELVNYAVKDVYGDYHVYGGYPYYSPSQLSDIGTRRLIPMCMLSPQWRKVANAEFEKAVALGASGMLYDESQHHGGAKYCFDKTHGHHVPAFVYKGDSDLAKGFRAISDRQKPDFLFAGEACYDLEYPDYDVSYFRFWSKEHIAAQRYIDSDKAMMIAVTGFDDRVYPNAAMRFKYIISLEPYNFKGHIEDVPLTLAYVEKIDNLRRRYKEFLWDGEFRDVLEATVKQVGEAHKDFSVFRSKAGKRAVVICNNDEKKTIEVEVILDGPSRPLVSVTPENPEPEPCKGKLTIPPWSAVVVMEQ